MKKILFIIITVLCLATTAHAQYDYVFKLPYPQRYFAIDSLFQPYSNQIYGVEVQRFLVQMKILAEKDNDKKALLQIAFLNYVVKKAASKNYPALAQMLDSLITAAEKMNDDYLLASLYMHKGWLNIDQEKYTRAFESFLKTYKFIEPMSREQFPSKNYFLYSIALNFYKFNDYEKAINIASQVNSFPNQYPLAVYTSDLLGMCYMKTARYDSARYWLKKTLDIVSVPDKLSTGWQGIALGNIGYTWYLQKENDKAIPYLEKGIALTTQQKLWDNTAGFCCSLADIYLQNKNTGKANELLQLARVATYAAGDDDNFYKLHTTLSNFYRLTRNASMALLHQDSMLFYKEKIATEKDNNQKVRAEFNFENEKRIAGEKLFLAETYKQKWIRNFIIGILFLLMLLGLMYYNRQRLHYLYKQQQLQNEKLKAEEDLHIASVQLADFTKSLKEKNILIETFSTEIEKLQALPCNVITPEQTASLNQIRQSAILTDEDWITFRNAFEKVHDGFLLRLTSKLPDLSPAETRFMALAKLQLSNKEMANILGVSTDAMRTIRYRLRRKLNLSEEGSIDELINTI